MDLSKYRNKLVGSEEERAVSPVIGVILMVAITVILAAVIAAFVLDMGDSMGDGGVNAAATSDVNESNSSATISVTDMGNADGITLVNSDGEVVNKDKILTSTGESQEYSDSGNLSGSYTIQAFTGETSLTTGDSLDSQVESTSIIGEFEV
ncbi:flagellin domain-containing protein [Haloterrigena salina JCM 13891]|uniref:Flagellin domain-containing protein n=1 Tax=Haloterrigena salina JCM 13891 TaxID=1227488 RepID=M0C836_9EURY|nr:type IV pilin N-terminal domain-containing protein [Haloterrigena salina]ELZ18074.1 flagellin domain-containing protein [Haloterrigena salina JCM 13891]